MKKNIEDFQILNLCKFFPYVFIKKCHDRDIRE